LLRVSKKYKPKNKEYYIFNIDDFCKDKNCQVFNLKKNDPTEIENCKTVCNFTSYELHRWLLSKGYSIVKNELLSKFIESHNQ